MAQRTDGLEAELGVTSSEFRSLAGMLISGLDVSLERALHDSES